MICAHCKQEKSLDQFCTSTHTKSGHQQPCKTCVNAKSTRKNRQRLRLLAEHPLTLACRECGLEKPVETFRPNKRFTTGYSDVCDPCVLQNLPTTLICTQCGIEKPLEDYASASKHTLGRQQPCNTCRYTRLKAKRLQHPNSYRAKHLKTTWICNRCTQEKPLKDFTTKAKSPVGHTQPCKACSTQESRARKGQDREKAHAQYRQWYLANREADRAHRHAMRTFKAITHRRWKIQHPAKARAKEYRRRKKAFPTTFTETERTFMLQYWSYSCAICGRQDGLFDHKLSDDHWIALEGIHCPGTIATNMIPLCIGVDGCNNSKGNRKAEDWLSDRYDKSKAARIMKAIQTYFDIVRQRAADRTAAAD